MSIDKLPTGGFHFRLDKGRGNFAYKLYKSTKRGELHNLSDNRKAIVESLKPHISALKRYGGLNRLQQKSVRQTIYKKEGGKISLDDRRDIKKVVKYMGRDKSARTEKDNPFAMEANGEKNKSQTAGIFARQGSGGQSASNIPKKGLGAFFGTDKPQAPVVPPRLRINKDASNVPSRVNPYLKRLPRSGPVRQMGIARTNPAAAESSIKRQEGGFVIPPPPGATPPKPISREEPSPDDGRLRRVT